MDCSSEHHYESSNKPTEKIKLSPYFKNKDYEDQ